MRYGCRGQGGAARPERGAIVPYRSAMRFGWRIGAALAMLFNAIPATAATPAEDAFVAWARTHAIDLPVCSSILSGADYSHLRSEEHTSELQSLMRISYAVFCWKKKNK